MTVALITDGIWPYVLGGMQKHSYFLCKYLAQAGVHVLLVHPDCGPDTHIELLLNFSESEKEFIHLKVLKFPGSFKFPGHYLWNSYLYSHSAFKSIFPEIGGVNLIIAKGLTGWYFVNHKRHLPPIAINIHGYEFLQKQANLKSRFESMLLRAPFIFINRRADYVFSYGGKISSLIRSIGVPPNRIIEIPAGIEKEWAVDKVKHVEGRRKLIFLGRYERRKGIEELHHALFKLLPTHNFEFHFVGPIPPERRISSDKIIYHGLIKTKEEIQELLQDSHVLVCPSYAEGMPNVILEAMANGCAVIASNVGAVDTFVDSSVGWLVEPGNSKQLGDAIVTSIELPTQELDELRKNAHKRIRERFLWDSISSRLLKSIEEMIQRI